MRDKSFGVEAEDGDEVMRREVLERVRAEGTAEVFELAWEDLEAGGHLVAAVRFEMFGAGVEGLGQVKAGDAAGAALADAVVEADHDRGAVELIDDATGDDADDAGVPAF